MFKGLTINQRFLALISLWIIIFYCYQLYYHYVTDKALENNNKSTSIYVRMLNEADSDNREIKEQLWKMKQARDYWEALYRGSQVTNLQLEVQVDALNEYWKGEYNKVSDELFDLRNKEDPNK